MLVKRLALIAFLSIILNSGGGFQFGSDYVWVISEEARDRQFLIKDIIGQFFDQEETGLRSGRLFFDPMRWGWVADADI